MVEILVEDLVVVIQMAGARMTNTKQYNWLVKSGAFVLMVVIITINSIAYAFTPPPAPTPPKSYIADVANKLNGDDLGRLNSRINQVNKSSSNEIAVLIIPSLDGELISEVAHETFNKWKVGKAGLDNGVLIVIAVADHKSRIEVGRGVEGDLTDIQSNDILRKNLNPHLKNGDFYGGLLETVNEISKTVESRKGQKATPAPSAKPVPSQKDNPPTGAAGCSVSAVGTNNNDWSGSIMLLILFVTVVLVYVGWRLFFAENKRASIPTPPPPPEPRRYYVPEPEPYIPPPPVRSYKPVVHHTYAPPPVVRHVYHAPPPIVVVSRDENDYVAPTVPSFFDDPPAYNPDPEPFWSSPTPSYEPESTPSYDSPSEPEPIGYGGGESDGGGSESSWDDGSNDSGTSDSSDDDS